MARDIEEFLRRAAERRQQQKGGGQPKPPPRQQPPREEPVRKPLRQQRPVEPEIIEAVPVSRPKPKPPRKKSSIRQQSVSDHVRSHIDTSDIAAHAEQLGDRIADIHERVDSNVHKHLDHDLTVLDDTASVTDSLPSAIFGKPTDAFAEELRGMLRDQKMVGRAIILAEILKRPSID